MANYDSEDLLEHPCMKMLIDIVPNIHWCYHIAEQLLDVERQEENNNRINLSWQKTYIDIMFVWEVTEQGFDFWATVNSEQCGYKNKRGLPWFLNGKLEWHERDWKP